MKTRNLLIFLFFVSVSVEAQWTQNGDDIYYRGGVRVLSNSNSENTSKLQVLHNISSSSQNRSAIIELGRNVNDESSDKWRFIARSSQPWGNNPLLSIQYLQGGAYSSYMTFNNNGNVGIATTNPTTKLDVHIEQDSGPIASFVSDGSVSTPDELRWTMRIGRSYDMPNRALEFGMVSDGYGQRPSFFIAPKGDEVFRVTHTGNVGIGITNPTHKLTVDGVISASEVKVSNTPNSDYVFEPDYPLLPLSEVETHIKEKKHLPGIPSAEEFKQNGVGLGEMDDMLLRKVEELVLYTIEQQKELERLRKENEALRKEKTADIHRLLKRIELLETRQQ